ncbi:class I SAM-dependent DNA methyltransferase [Azospirillum doebereinerae]|uniref:Class I SAM-dependent methyltransferase n=1 Tax=Azospirillum doebereinerae TaxID=92933 RepID=A0A433J717_9PROT|nr:class I SAM-dependent methyltransferase [Azospirillum doebereinerae]MCG5238918.1 class I SAM-dependent methyltransferase [Azospirillum doebereinerae]RUQ68936.1 class I SAM-dependent methyltransferase [Azospirillum doebereinerae]
MTGVFGEGYAAAYDNLYRSKDYEGECDLIERILAEHGGGGPRRLLDLGCGTGGHALPLAQRGHRVTGVDRSPGMLVQAREKAGQMTLPAGVDSPAFHQGDVRDLELGRRFEAVLMMFAVLGYQHENADLLAALATVRRHLEPGGLFVFDVWNGAAVLSDRPGQRIRTVRENDDRIVRTTETRLDAVHQRCHVRFNLLRIKGDRVVDEQDEEHVMRFFFPQELGLALGFAKLQLLDLRGFPDYAAAPDERAWNVIGVARAV